MKSIRGFVVAALLTVWSFPAVSLATPVAPSRVPAPVTAPVATPVGAGLPASTAEAGEAGSYAQRDAAARQLADFVGGESVGLYIGGSTLALALLIVLLIIIL
jgi:hypothetical protein